MTTANQEFIETLEGPIDPSQLGIALVHEHILLDLSFMFTASIDRPDLAHAPITLENLHWIRSHPASNKGNARLASDEDALEDLISVHSAGINSVVDVSMRGEKFLFEPARVKELARQANLQVVMGTGYYTDASIPSSVKLMAVEAIAEEMMFDLHEGYPGTSARAGVIGEVGTSYPITDTEKKVLQAAVIVQRRTGSALYLHPGYSERAPLELAELVEEWGVNPNKVILCHIDSRIRGDLGVLATLAKRGFYLGFDTFGREQYLHHLGKQHPSDAQRITWLKELCEAGYLDQMLISSDVCWKFELSKYGGYGRGYVVREIVPRLKQEGFSEREVQDLIVSNPARALARPITR